MMSLASALAELSRPQARTAAAAGWLPRPDEVDVWRASLDAQPPEVMPMMQALISADEAERAQRFYFERDRRRFVIGRGLLRALIGRYLGVAPQQVAFRYGAHGKPMLACAGTPPLHFNVAHSEGLLVCAFATLGEIGLDVERVREVPEWETIALAYFGPRELSRLRESRPAARRTEFFRAWTRQEALLKAHGIGLGGTAQPERRPGANAAALVRQPELELAFHLHPLDTESGFAGALAVPPGVRWMTMLTWQPENSGEQAAAPRRARRTRLEEFPNTGSVSL